MKTTSNSIALCIYLSTLSLYIQIIFHVSTYKAEFTQMSLSDLTLDQSKVRSDKVFVNTLNRVGKPGR